MFKPRRPRFWLVLLFVLYVAAGIVASITIGRPDAAIAILAFIAATIAAGFWLMRRVGPMLVLVILMVAQQASADTFSLVAGVFVDKEIGTAAVPYASGTWGTDYLTSAHVMRMGAAYRVTWDGKTFDDADIVPWPGLHRRSRRHESQLVLWAIAPQSEMVPDVSMV
ncbi:MAG: hypothetical protein ACRDFW_09030 [bacterium]